MLKALTGFVLFVFKMGFRFQTFLKLLVVILKGVDGAQSTSGLHHEGFSTQANGCVYSYIIPSIISDQ